MARIAGVNIPTNKRVEIALTYIHGIGRTTAKEIIGKLYVNYSLSVKSTWEKDNAGYIAQAERNWPAVLQK